MLRVFYSDHYEVPLPLGHRFPMGKYRVLRTRVEKELANYIELVAAPFATTGELALAHDPNYVKNFCSGAIDARMMRTIGLPWSEALVARTLASAGGTLAALRHALQAGVSANLAGGTHHAGYASGSGFCVFNDLAIAARFATNTHQHRVLIFDADVHQGDGTASILANDRTVFTTSIHGARNFPFVKQTSSFDLELEDGCADREYLAAIERAWTESLRQFTPTVVLYQAGVDALASDKLGRLAVSQAGLAQRDRFVFEQVRALGLPLVWTLGGGYAQPIEDSIAAHFATYQVAAEVFAR